MSVSNGEIRLPIEDLLDIVLARVEPVEIAEALWADRDVRDRFVECLHNQYASDHVNDATRRQFLALVQEEVHSKSLSRAASAASSIEHDRSCNWYFWDQISQLNTAFQSWAERARKVHPDIEPFDPAAWPVMDPAHSPDFKIGGKTWEEAREHWRARLEQLFAHPEVPVHPVTLEPVAAPSPDDVDF